MYQQYAFLPGSEWREWRISLLGDLSRNVRVQETVINENKIAIDLITDKLLFNVRKEQDLVVLTSFDDAEELLDITVNFQRKLILINQKIIEEKEELRCNKLMI